MASERGAFRRMVDYFTADLDRVFTVAVLALIFGGLLSCSSCHVTISINNSKPAEASNAK